ncbi:MAG: DNA polymerase III subunit gamma/tau [Sulfurovaceae bacterium]|nr:DNA polymerase III subunit gamma/tau [Sulfurovaceae bacterium]
MSLALARKYRPATFEDLIGQESVSQTLSLALESDRLSHAYLFSGLRGSGKTSTARIFAKALLCEKRTTSHPCGICSSCVMANEGRHMDIIEMDGASNRKIDDIRELIEHTKYKPAVGKYKIFIIDEVHMLTKEAFNALLKTLEEPPAFVKFILATTDPLKLPATILSRTQHFRFRKISQPILERHLEHILNLEGVEYEREAISIIARSGAGSVRDALTLLDQAIVYSKNFIDISTITNMLGIIEPSLIENLVNNILQKDKKSILEFVSSSGEFEAEMIIDEILLYLKDLLLSGSHKITPMVIEKFFRVLADSKTLLSIGTDGEFVLSLSFFKMMESLETKYIEESKSISTPKSIKEIIKEKVKVVEKKIEPVEEKKKLPIEKPKVEESIDKGLKLFENLVAKLYDRNYELGQCFESNITYNSFDNNRLTWESTAIDSDKKLLINNWGLIRMFVQEIFGIETKIKNISKELPHSIKCDRLIDEPISIIDDDKVLAHEESMKSSCIAPTDGGVESAKEKDERRILDEPMVAKALELFAPKKVRIKRKN